MGFFGPEEKKKIEANYEEMRRKAFNGDSFLLYEKFLELDKTFHQLYPMLDNVLKYKNYFDAVTKYFSSEGGDKAMEFQDTLILNESISKEIIFALQMFPVDNKDEELSKKAIYEYQLLSDCFNTVADLMYSDEEYIGQRSYNQYLKDRQDEAEREKQRIEIENSLPTDYSKEIENMKVERSKQYCDAYSNIIITLSKELKATNGFFTRDSKEYKALSACLQREAGLLQVSNLSEDGIKESLSELSFLADAYIRHVPKNPDSRQKNRSDICNTIKAVAKFAQNGMANPRDGLERMFIKTLVYNDDPECFSPQKMQETTKRALDIYDTPSVKEELAKLSVVRLVAPLQKNLDVVNKKYNEAVVQKNKSFNLSM